VISPRRKAAKVSDSAGYRQLLRWAALPVTDRRWAAPLCAVALGFGLFAGVAIGPGAAGTFATGAAQVIEIPGFSGGTSSDESSGDEGGGPSTSAESSGAGSSGGEGSASSESSSAFPSFAPTSEGESEESSEASEKTPPKNEASPPEEEAEPEAQALSGIVVHVNPAAGSYTLAEAGGTIDSIHAGKTPQPGTKVSVPVRLLANGTFAEAGTRKKSGTRTRATFSGIVTWLEPTPTAPAYVVSKRGVSVLVRVHPDPTGAAPALPALGAFATVAVDIEKPQPPATSSTAPPAGSPVETLAVPAEAPQAAAVPATEAPVAPAPTCAPDPSLPPLRVFAPTAILWQRQISAAGEIGRAHV